MAHESKFLEAHGTNNFVAVPQNQGTVEAPCKATAILVLSLLLWNNLQVSWASQEVLPQPAPGRRSTSTVSRKCSVMVVKLPMARLLELRRRICATSGYLESLTTVNISGRPKGRLTRTLPGAMIRSRMEFNTLNTDCGPSSHDPTQTICKPLMYSYK